METHRAAVLDREEYIEQTYFFRSYRDRLSQNIPSQEILQTIQEEILATTRLPMAIDFLKGEILLTGRISDGMARLSHYFAPFQAFVMSRAEEDRSRFDQQTALLILEREAEYRASVPAMAGLFVYQFECLARNRLGYDEGMRAMAGDPIYTDDWSAWILKTRLNLGTRDFAHFIHARSQVKLNELRRQKSDPTFEPEQAVLFSEQEGRIAWANRGRDPLYMFAALQRHLGYPPVPRPARPSSDPVIHPALEQRLQRIEKHLKLVEAEQKGGLDLSQFYARPADVDGPNFDLHPGRT